MSCRNRTWEDIHPGLLLFIMSAWQIMARTGKGHRLNSIRRTGIGEDRRKDKLEFKGPQ